MLEWGREGGRQASRNREEEQEISEASQEKNRRERNKRGKRKEETKRDKRMNKLCWGSTFRGCTCRIADGRKAPGSR